ncbi:unnamed protein product [Euphydryas editha]|uniref:HTH psq-type domain-containing protein n=1 Tax=Euphydryas editha TaxID=104508 RepID=A0AAU9URJ4_EUPED|nr:unnamed protein product [Euphydryas editha]
MKAAINAVQKGRLTQRVAAARYNIPRRTLRDHLKTGQEIKRFGRKPILTKKQEEDLAARIKRFANIGIPLTTKFIRKQAFLFCERYDITNNFGSSKRVAGVDWLRSFLKRNPSISKRKPQIMNPARAQKLNKPIVQQHFQTILEEVYVFSSDENQSFIDKGESTPNKQYSEQDNIPNDDTTNYLDDDNVPLSNLRKEPGYRTEFHNFLPTPNYAITKTNRLRKKAINYKGQRITKDLFDKKGEDKKKIKNTKTKSNNKSKKYNKNNTKIETKNMYMEKKTIYEYNKQEKRKIINQEKDNTEEWYCYACHENIKLDMRQCGFCKKWYHEECVGLSKYDKEFICSNCD